MGVPFNLILIDLLTFICAHTPCVLLKIKRHRFFIANIRGNIHRKFNSCILLQFFLFTFSPPGDSKYKNLASNKNTYLGQEY